MVQGSNKEQDRKCGTEKQEISKVNIGTVRGESAEQQEGGQRVGKQKGDTGLTR
jgi:hypothetical protein